LNGHRRLGQFLVQSLLPLLAELLRLQDHTNILSWTVNLNGIGGSGGQQLPEYLCCDIKRVQLGQGCIRPKSRIIQKRGIMALAVAP
jgi:hypothetical protein